MALFFAPAWQHKNPQKRIDALAKLPSAKAAEIIEQLATQDSDSNVRAAAIERIASPGKLFQLIKHSESAVQEQLRQALISRLDNEQSMALESRQRWLRNGDDNKVLGHLARYATEPELRKTALLQLDQQSLWQQCVANDPAQSNRELAISRISSTNALKQLIESVRKTDKKTTRLLQQTLEQRLLDDGDTDTLHAIQLRLCEQLDALIKQQADKAALRVIENEWAQIAGGSDADKALTERYQRARRVFLRMHEAPEITEPAPKQEQAPEEAAESNQSSAISAANTLATQAKQWLKAEQAPRKKQLAKLREQWKSLKAEVSDNELVNHTTELLSQLNQRLVQQDEQWKKDLAEIMTAIPTIEPQLADGQLQQAKKLYAELETRLQGLKAIENRAELRAAFVALNEIKPALQDLAKWQHWGNNRKRRELCEKVEALIEQDIEPEALAEQIKAAQAEWKTLEQSETTAADKRRASPALWRRFQTACRKAWEPCAEHFEQKKQQRSLKLGHIEKTIEELAAFGDKTKQFDEQVLHTAVRTGYRMLGDLHRMPRKESRAIEKRLREVLAPFQESQDRIQKQASYAKRQLVEKAQSIDPAADLKAAINSIKQLQADWKKTGRAEPKEDQKLWQEFRAQADRIFGKLDQQRQQEQQQSKAADQALSGVIKQIQTLAKEVADHTAGELQKLRSEAAELETSSHNRKLHKDLEDAVSMVKSALNAHKNQQRLNALNALREQAKTQAQDIAEDATRDAEARDAVIKMEILASADSPAEDKARRLALQVDQLAASLSGGANAGDLISLIEKWYQDSAINAKLWAKLDQRITKLLDTRS